MSTLIVLRGNSGSGKSTVAQALQKELSGAWIEQDYFRRTVLGETGNYSQLSVDLIERTAALVLASGRTLILEGMLNSSMYSRPLRALRDGNPGPNLFYAYELTLEETLRRHATRPHKAADFGERQMRGWFHGWDPLDGIPEQRITAAETADQTLARILTDARR